MNTDHPNTHSNARNLGLQIREKAIEHFQSREFRAALRSALAPDNVARQQSLPVCLDINAIRHDMAVDDGWSEEFWVLDDADDVHLVSEDAFAATPQNRRFSKSECLRKPRQDAFALRGLLSALTSPEVAAVASDVTGVADVRFLTADIARYQPGHYLRRHDDVYDGRIFALVFFLHADWERPFGGQLVAEKPDGRSTVVDPIAGTYGLMRLAGGHFHFVTANASTDWTRMSMAVHFGVNHA